MMTKKIGYFTGQSNLDIHEAIEMALEQAGEHAHFEVVETSCSQAGQEDRQYQVTVTAFSE